VELVRSFALLAAVTWLIVRAANQRGLLQLLVPAPRPPALDAPRVAVIVPARNEAHNIGRCLRGLIEQDYPPGRLLLLVVDDHSTDATASIASSLAEAHPQIGVLASPPLPPHWIGKSHACWLGACAVSADTEWLCFLDADVHAQPALLASAVAAATSERLDLLSLAPKQELVSFAERLVMPCGLYLLAFCQDLRKMQSPKSPDATATGQFMLVRSTAYREIGGHAAVRREICEDLALARCLKQAGRQVILRDGSRLLSTRMYTGWQTLRPGIAKNLVEMLGGPVRTLVTVAAGVGLAWAIWLVPLSDGLHCSFGSAAGCTALLPGLIAGLAAVGLHVAGASHFRIPLWYGLLFPLGYTTGALIAIDSLLWRWRGRVAWKGRDYQ
jgi:chlorobactene glucosyltransferase